MAKFIFRVIFVLLSATTFAQSHLSRELASLGIPTERGPISARELHMAKCYSASFMLGAHVNDYHSILRSMGLGNWVISSAERYVQDYLDSTPIEDRNDRNAMAWTVMLLTRYQQMSTEIGRDRVSFLTSDLVSDYVKCRLY